MKIATIVRGFHKHGGISRCAAEIAERCAQNNEVHVFTNHFESKTGKIIHHKIQPYRLKYPQKLAITSEFLSFALKTYKELKCQEFNIIHSHSSASFVQDIITAHSCHKASIIKIERYLKNSRHRFHYLKEFARPFNAINIAIESIQYKRGNFKKIVAISSSLKNELIEFFGVDDEDITVIPNGVDLNQFSPDSEIRKQVRMDLGFKDEDIVISFVSHRFANKGLDFLIEAISLVNKKEIKLLIVSGDDPKEQLQLADDLGVINQIKLYGATTQPENAYKASDIFVFPSLYEGFGLVTLEAMSVGLPVIVTDVGGAPDVIVNNKNGFLISTPPDPEEIAEILNLLCEDDRLRETIGAKARESVTKYSWDNIALETLKLYRECL